MELECGICKEDIGDRKAYDFAKLLSNRLNPKGEERLYCKTCYTSKECMYPAITTDGWKGVVLTTFWTLFKERELVVFESIYGKTSILPIEKIKRI